MGIIYFYQYSVSAKLTFVTCNFKNPVSLLITIWLQNKKKEMTDHNKNFQVFKFLEKTINKSSNFKLSVFFF